MTLQINKHALLKALQLITQSPLNISAVQASQATTALAKPQPQNLSRKLEDSFRARERETLDSLPEFPMERSNEEKKSPSHFFPEHLGSALSLWVSIGKNVSGSRCQICFSFYGMDSVIL